MITDDSGPDLARRRDGRGVHARSGPARADRRGVRGGALGPGDGRPRPPGGTSCPARRRGAASARSTRSCRRSRPSGRASCWSSTAAAQSRPVAPTWAPSGRSRPVAAALDLPDRRRGRGLPAGAGRPPARPGRLRGRARGGRGRARPGHRDAAVLAARPVRPGRPGRGGAPARGVRRRSRPRCRPRPPAGAHRGAAPAAGGRGGAGRGRATSRCCRSRSSAPPTWDALGLPPTTPAAAPCTCATRSTRTGR